VGRYLKLLNISKLWTPKHELLEIVFGIVNASRFASLFHCGNPFAINHGDEREHYQHSDQRKTAGGLRPRREAETEMFVTRA